MNILCMQLEIAFSCCFILALVAVDVELLEMNLFDVFFQGILAPGLIIALTALEIKRF